MWKHGQTPAAAAMTKAAAIAMVLIRRPSSGVREISNPTTNANDQPGTTNHQVPTTNHELEPAQLQVSSHLQPPTTSGYSSGGV